MAILIWEIGRRHRQTIALAIFVILAGLLFDGSLWSNRETVAARDRRLTVDAVLMIVSILLVFAIFNYTEFNRQKEWTGFPYRLFTLPVPTWLIVALPMGLGVVSVEFIFWTWMKFVFTDGEVARAGLIAALLGAFMAVFHAILWGLAGFKILRLIALGLGGAAFIGIGFLPAFADLESDRRSRENVLIFAMIGVAAAAFLASWSCVARQRYGGGRRQNWVHLLVDRVSDVLPRRRKLFESPADAQFWLEWRRSGCLLPVSVGAILVVVIAPLSVLMRSDPGTSLWILFWTLAAPIVLALPIGKGFSKPDFWSRELAMPAFIAVRPFSSGGLIVIKMKVAALSAIISWVLVLGFLGLWLNNWADLSGLGMIRVAFWMAYGHRIFPQYLIAALFIVAGSLLTWKFLIGGLWIGLSGNRRRFIGSMLAGTAAWCGGLIGLAILADHDKALRAWLREDPNRLLAFLEWLAAAAIIVKVWLAARTWRSIQPVRVQRFTIAWIAATVALIVFAFLLWADGSLTLVLMSVLDLLPLDPDRLRNLLILCALLFIPFARLGAARGALVKNRHG